jgi:hypothetical protein
MTKASILNFSTEKRLSITKVANSWNVHKSSSNLYQHLPLDCDVYIVQGFGTVFFEVLTNRKYFENLVNSGLISNETVQKAKKVDNYSTSNDKIEILYQIGFEFSHFVLNKIWLPSDKIKYEIDTL